MVVGVDARVVFTSTKEDCLEYTIRLHFLATNNVPEYEALIHGLKIASELGARCLYIRGNLELVIDQVMKEDSCREEEMIVYSKEVWKLQEKFDGLELHHILRHDNLIVDFLAKLTSSLEHAPPEVFVNDAYEPSIKLAKTPDLPLGLGGLVPTLEPTPGNRQAPTDHKVLMLEPNWTTPYFNYLLWGTLPNEVTEARHLARRAKAFVVIGEELYKRSPSGILLLGYKVPDLCLIK
ncbi:uncharacterized protein [Setaria viridis]|uniref:uncharacterized protein n=1 Tax=Setaria viridis TaxID=4556 RepID=UPI003B3B2579